MRVIARGVDAPERINDDEPGLRMLLQELLDLFHQPVVELLGHDAKCSVGGASSVRSKRRFWIR